MKGAKRYTDYKINILCIQIFLGMFICSCVIFSFVGDGSKNLKLNETEFQTSHRIYRRSADANETDLALANLMQGNISETSSTATTSTTAKVHLKKPEAADGSFLEQGHVTKPLMDNKATTRFFTETSTVPTISFQSEPLRNCLLKLNRTCSIKLSKCTKKQIFIDFSNSSLNTYLDIELQNSSQSCRFTYEYSPSRILNINAANVFNSDLCVNIFNSSSSFNQTELDILRKTYTSMSFLNTTCIRDTYYLIDLIEPGKQLSSNCLAEANFMTKTSTDLQVNNHFLLINWLRCFC